MKKMLSTGNILNAVVILLFLALVFIPSAKAMVLEGLMKIGFFSADIPAAGKKETAALTSVSGIRFKDANGNITDLSDLKGKVVFLNFWATWCPPCRAELPAIHKLYERFKNDKDIVFILVDADGKLSRSQEFMDRKKYGLPVYAVASEIPEALFQGMLPTTAVFDKQGRMVYNESGAANYGHRKFIEFIEQLKNTN